ncbi:unnamed protein product [Leptosia nina]|uniref:Uncharacterized protein n=1 Tax=Leptosia nina TaxID=320188 RepID=A0AAV1JS81_9NEOP
MEHDIVNTKFKENRVSSAYAEIYLDDDYCSKKYLPSEPVSKIGKGKRNRRETIKQKEGIIGDWISPSDLLIGIIDLKPPFTSKINRGKTHEGILHIGNTVLEHERARFLKSLSDLIRENNSSWQHILKHEKEAVVKRVKQIYENIFKQKSKIMTDEIARFYEETLEELEEHLKSEIQPVLKSAHANIISTLNNDIKQKLRKEKRKLEDVLRKRLLSEVKKIDTYYNLLYRNELSRNENIICEALHERNNAIQAFLKLVEAEKFTTSMYVMSLERKKCKIKKMLLRRHHNAETLEKLSQLREKKDIADSLREREVNFSKLNEEWEEKIKKVLQLFLKFISFSLKLLPEQSTFLLDFEKMVILQLNEIQKDHEHAPSILIDETELINTFKFTQHEQEEYECDKEPFILIGDLSDPIPPRYGSRETLESNVELPFIRLQRQYMYAKCYEYKEIKKFLKSQICRCHKMPSPSPSKSAIDEDKVPIEEIHIPPVETVSSDELLLCEDFKRLNECPARKCTEMIKTDSFPLLPSYMDFSEDNYRRVTAILNKTPDGKVTPEMVQPKEVVYRELPFSVTKERSRNVETQYSSQETINEELNVPCTCTCNEPDVAKGIDSITKWRAVSNDMNIALNKRKISLQRLMQERPNLLQLFTEENYDYKIGKLIIP